MVGLSVRPNEGANPALNLRYDQRIQEVTLDPIKAFDLDDCTLDPCALVHDFP